MLSLSAYLLIFAFGIQSKAVPPPRTPSPPTGPALKFRSAAAQKYAVPQKLPLMDFSITQTYAGLMKLSDKPGSTDQQLFFWFIPTENPAAVKNLALWTNGGPGCSSLVGAFQENGPIMWDSGRSKAIKNPNSWSQAANMLYLEHPANVGFSIGKAVINNENQVADYIFKFLTNFLKVFPEMNSANFYLTGESYAGLFISYTANLIYARQSELALKLKGVLFIDPVLSSSVLQEDVFVYPFVKSHPDVIKFNATFMKELESSHKTCGYADFIEKYYKFPVPGRFPNISSVIEGEKGKKCKQWSKMSNALPDDFDIYNIRHKTGGPDPLFSDVIYLDRPDVRKALNVGGNVPWLRCSDATNIFPNGDSSPIPSIKVLPEIISKGRTIVVHGDLDARLLLEGQKLGLQSMTWGGKQGFQKPIDINFMVDGKLHGKYRTERGLTFVQVSESGHMVPHDQPEASLAIFEFLIGKRANL